MELTRMIICCIVSVSLFVVLADSAPLEHSLTKRHVPDGISTAVVKSRRRRGISRNKRIRQMYVCLQLIRDMADHRNFAANFLPHYCKPIYCANLIRTSRAHLPTFCTDGVNISVIQK